jgi:pyridoxine kinase
MKGDSLKKSTKLAMNGVYNLITLNKDAADPYMGLPLEKYLNIL